MTSRRFAVALALAAVVVATAGAAGPVRLTTDEPIAGPAVATAQARRGQARQVTPTLPPPESTWKLGAVDGCDRGELIRWVDVGDQKIFTLTFDDGPDPVSSPQLMDILSSRGATATFFVVGLELQAHPATAREIVRRGFAIGNHSVTHQYLWTVNAREVGEMNALIQSVLGVRTPYYRAPGLSIGVPITQALMSSRQCYVFTDSGLGDHLMPRLSASTLCSAFAANLRPGSIVLLHDSQTHRPTIDALPCMLDVARSRGYRAVSLMTLLRSGTPMTAPRTSGLDRVTE